MSAADRIAHIAGVLPHSGFAPEAEIRIWFAFMSIPLLQQVVLRTFLAVPLKRAARHSLDASIKSHL
jgi:hypothetical protein